MGRSTFASDPGPAMMSPVQTTPRCEPSHCRSALDHPMETPLAAAAPVEPEPERRGPAPVRFAEDAELARRAADGDEPAFDRLYADHVRRVYATCLRMCADPERARRLTQDVFVRAWERLESYRGESRFSSWLHRVTVNVVIESQRGRKRWRRLFVRETEAEATPTATSASPASVVPREGDRLDLERAIASLPPGARTALVLRDVEGHSYEEVAELMGVAMGTVKAQIHRARRLMRERLER